MERFGYQYNEQTNSFKIVDEPNGVLPHIVWHITDLCSLKCPFCFATKTQDEFDIALLDDYIQIFKKLGVQRIDISGGEPLLYPNLDIVVDTLKSHGFYLTITTSSVGNRRNKEWLITNAKKISWIIVSVDGHTKELHEALRGKGTFESAISFLNSLSKSNLRINSVVTKSFLEANTENMIMFIQTLPIKEWCLIMPSAVNMKPSFNDVCINREDFDALLISVKKMTSNKSNINVIHRYPENYSGYWILYPNNKLILHNENDCDKDIIIEFESKNFDNIINTITNQKIWLPMENKIEIKNTDENLFVSDLLKIALSVLESERIKVNQKEKTASGTKGVITTSIIIGIVTGVTANLITDAIKFAINKLKNREDYSPNFKIEINNTIIVLKDIENSNINVDI